MKHIAVFTNDQVAQLLNGRLKFDLRFFKKKPEFFKELNSGDIIFFRKKGGEILGQFEVGKIVIIERIENRDWGIVKELKSEKLELTEEEFIEKVKENSSLLMIQINKLEQLITSPIEIDKRSKKEWTIISEQ